MANPEKPSDHRRRRPIEHSGVGQSGYTAGRRHDPALDRSIETRHVAHGDAPPDDLGVDDRFTGRGGSVLEKDDEASDPDDSDPEDSDPGEVARVLQAPPAGR